jgi:AraC-like DNA-binding protein
VFGAPHGAFSGLVLWDDPTEHEIAQMLHVLDGRLRPELGPHATVIDARRIKRIDPLSFLGFGAWVVKRQRQLRVIPRLAVLHGSGLPGAAVAGFPSVLPQLPLPIKFFQDDATALQWLGREQDSRLFAEVGRLVEQRFGTTPLVAQLGAFLESHPRADLAGAASALAVSTRSLQRRLHEFRTSFKRELHSARLRVAQRLLVDSNANVARIAAAAGFATPQHLGALFRTMLRESPTGWRERARKTVPTARV